MKRTPSFLEWERDEEFRMKIHIKIPFVAMTAVLICSATALGQQKIRSEDPSMQPTVTHADSTPTILPQDQPITRSIASKLGHFVARHKASFVSAGFLIGIEVAQATSTIYAQRVCPSCKDQGFFGAHPSHAQTWGASAMISTSLITADFLSDKYAPDASGNAFLHVLATVPITIDGVWCVVNNYNVPVQHTTPTQQARRRLLSDKATRE